MVFLIGNCRLPVRPSWYTVNSLNTEPPAEKMSAIIVWKSAICLILLSLLTRMEASVLTDCRRETQVSWESLRSLATGDFSTSDPRVKCYVKCYMSRIGVLDENGRVDFDALRRLTPDYRVLIAKFGDCVLATGTDPCDKAFQIAKCIASREKNLEISLR